MLLALLSLGTYHRDLPLTSIQWAPGQPGCRVTLFQLCLAQLNKLFIGQIDFAHFVLLKSLTEYLMGVLLLSCSLRLLRLVKALPVT